MHIGGEMDGLDSQFKTVKPKWAPHLSFTTKPAKVGTDHTIHPSSNVEEIRVLQTKETHEHDIAIPFFFHPEQCFSLATFHPEQRFHPNSSRIPPSEQPKKSRSLGEREVVLRTILATAGI